MNNSKHIITNRLTWDTIVVVLFFINIPKNTPILRQIKLFTELKIIQTIKISEKMFPNSKMMFG